MRKSVKKDLQFIKKCFGQKKDASGRYVWRHAHDAALYLEKIARKYKETDPAMIDKLYLAVLGHDLLEDTKAAKNEIQKKWGKDVLKYIEALTNKKGDTDFSGYIKQLRDAREEVLLVKFADIFSNVSNSVRFFGSFDSHWIKTFWLPLLKDYNQNLFGRKFLLYPRTASAMIKDIQREIRNLLKNAIKNKN